MWLADDATAEGFGGSGAVSEGVPRLPDHPTMHEAVDVLALAVKEEHTEKAE